MPTTRPSPKKSRARGRRVPPSAADPPVTRTTDAKARVSLPKNFANATVIIEPVSETELRIRKAKVVPEDEVRFWEEAVPPLSDRDRDFFLKLLDNPPPPNKALRRAMSRYKKLYG